MNRRLIIVGAGGVACEALWVFQRINALRSTPGCCVLGWVDDDPARKGELVEGLPILGPSEQVCQEWSGQDLMFHCAVGDNRGRQRLAGLFERAGFEPLSLIDPSAVIAPTAQVGMGTYVGPLTIIAPHSRVGRHVLVNVSASIGHHCECGDFSQVCPGGRVSGHARLEEGAFVASNAVVGPRRTIDAWARVGAASFASRDVKAGVTVIGVPARTIFGS